MADGRTAEQLADEIDKACAANGYEWRAEITAGSLCCWGCKLTVILTPDRADGPDRSLVTMAAGGNSPEGVLRDAWDDMRAWLDQLAGRADAVKAARARVAARAGGEVDTGT